MEEEVSDTEEQEEENYWTDNLCSYLPSFLQPPPITIKYNPCLKKPDIDTIKIHELLITMTSKTP